MHSGLSTGPDAPVDGVSLSSFTTMGVGGPAARMFRVPSYDSFLHLREQGAIPESFTVLGGGSNVVISDQGLDMTVLIFQALEASVDVQIDAAGSACDAMLEWHAVAMSATAAGLGGLETLVGIPGTVGGAIVQNIGAYGYELAERVIGVVAFDRLTGTVVNLTADECGFGYRTSRFKRDSSGRFVILQARLLLDESGVHRPRYAELADKLRADSGSKEHYRLPEVSEAVLALRASKCMVFERGNPDTRGVGSFFVNPIVDEAVAQAANGRAGLAEAPMPSWPAETGVKLSAGWLVERSGYHRGYRSGNVGLCPGHTLGLVNVTGTATTDEVLSFAGAITRAVEDKFGVALEMEPVPLGFSPGDLQRHGVRPQEREIDWPDKG